MLARIALTQQRYFAKASRYVGPNDMIRQERHKLRKYGLKRHFYDNIPIAQRLNPKGQYRAGLTPDELAGYSDQVKQAFDLNNASETEIVSARFREVQTM